MDMNRPGLSELARRGDRGRLEVLIFEDEHGQLVLDAPDGPSREGLRPLGGLDCMRLAAAAAEGPTLVVETNDGAYVVLPEADPVDNRHIPLSLDDAEILTGPAPAVGRFGRREDDVISLTPWVPDETVFTFDPDAPEFADVVVVRYADGDLTIERGDLDDGQIAAVTDRLEQFAGPDAERFGVFTNAFGEFMCVPVGGLIEPHEDLRYQTVLHGAAVTDGAQTLGEAAARLREYADRLETAESQGWKLPEPISMDHAFPERPRP